MHRFHDMPFGAQLADDGVRFSLWAPTAREVELVLDGAARPMEAQEGGWRRLVVPEAKAGARYGFRIDGGLVVPDPASRFQPDDVHRDSLVVDPRSYAWRDASWTGRPWEETVLYELHVGTATPEGTYAGLERKLEELRDLGITAIELLPLADFPGKRGWGYDGVLPYAPDAAYGTPDDLKRLIDRAHALGLMIFIDVVYNHFGPAGNYLHAYAKSFFTERHQTPWGAGINFDGEAAPAVRDYFVHNALYWLEEYHVDGLRFDAVHAILDDSTPHIIEEIATRARAALPGREVHLVLENGANEARWLPRDEAQRPRLHTAQWNDDIHHCWHVVVTGESDGYYEDYADRGLELLGRCLTQGFAYQGEMSGHEGKPRGEPSGHLPPSAFVAFLQNHDQIGNRAFGERISALADERRLTLARAGLLLTPQIPMLYMGEEWSASAPFLYFVDFSDDPDLAKAVRDGRRREFANFKSFAEQHGERQIPDPTLEETFTLSKLDWTEATHEPHAAVRADVRDLLRLRQAEIVPLAKTRFIEASYALPAPGALVATWRYEGGTLRFAMNVGDAEAGVEAPGRVIWSSPGVAGEGTRRLPSWTALVAKE
ncbi:MAG TPA: malto-oligosyltrehalose trehalohydrolase [Salinarimonas sp.]|jgi:maltooligosyltrehalose trehalohydrolase|nr:malto-oligosyltrehalose trehalohydrolase [Salinarimonas sp.]